MVDASFKHFAPRPKLPMIQWAREHVRLQNGAPYDHDAYPHLGAPGGPCDAIDDPLVRVIWLMFASRLGKTVFGLAFQMFVTATCPGPGLFVSATEKLTKEIINTRLYPMLEQCRPLRGQLKPQARRKADRIDLLANRIFVGWARSPSTLADKGIKYGHANEIDKWEHVSTSKEGDPGDLFAERHKDYPAHKSVRESTPAEKGSSRIDAGMQQSTNCRYNVPCPKCKKFQRIEQGDGQRSGLRWDKGADGRSDPDLAFKTARYVCCHCQAELGDEFRGWMMRRGVWIPEGCRPDHRKALKAAEDRLAGGCDKSIAFCIGEPRRCGSDAGYQLSSLHALTLSWGDYARQFLRTLRKPQLKRNFVNSWEGLPYAPTKSKTPPEQLAERLAGQHHRGQVPSWAAYLTVGVDKQRASGGFFPFFVAAWGAEERGALVEWGEVGEFDELLREVLIHHYPCADGGAPFVPMLDLLDSSDDTKAVYDFCRGKRGVLPAKGLDAKADWPYRVVMLGLGASRASRTAAKSAIGQPLVHINVDYWETEIQARLEDRKPGEPGSFELPPEAGADLDLCEQLLNGCRSEHPDRRGEARLLWMKRDMHAPNDYRDAFRMALCAAKVVLDERGGRLPQRSAAAAPKVHAVRNPGEGRPDGRPWY